MVKIKKLLILILCILVCFLIQTSLLPYFSLAGIVPNIMLILVVSYAYIVGQKEGMLLGFFVGLLMDLFCGELMGPYALFYTYIGYFSGFFHFIYYTEIIILPLILIVGLDFVFNMGIYVMFFLLRNRLDFGFYFSHIIIPEMIYTLAVGVFLYKILHAVFRHKKPEISEGGI
ncbi:MAG: rod shape-determining protein MreD [Lachnospiraceae bacterium]|nr:rod shape-determining protein MreD [Lachnospiraceae bacterium]